MLQRTAIPRRLKQTDGTLLSFGIATALSLLICISLVPGLAAQKKAEHPRQTPVYSGF